MSIPLTQSEQDLLGQMARFTEKHAVNGVYLNQGFSKSLGGVPVLFLCALGDQALALQQVIMKAAVPDEQTLIHRAATQDFAKETGNGNG